MTAVLCEPPELVSPKTASVSPSVHASPPTRQTHKHAAQYKVTSRRTPNSAFRQAQPAQSTPIKYKRPARPESPGEQPSIIVDTSFLEVQSLSQSTPVSKSQVSVEPPRQVIHSPEKPQRSQPKVSSPLARSNSRTERLKMALFQPYASSPASFSRTQQQVRKIRSRDSDVESIMSTESEKDFDTLCHALCDDAKRNNNNHGTFEPIAEEREAETTSPSCPPPAAPLPKLPGRREASSAAPQNPSPPVQVHIRSASRSSSRSSLPYFASPQPQPPPVPSPPPPFSVAEALARRSPSPLQEAASESGSDTVADEISSSTSSGDVECVSQGVFDLDLRRELEESSSRGRGRFSPEKRSQVYDWTLQSGDAEEPPNELGPSHDPTCARMASPDYQPTPPPSPSLFDMPEGPPAILKPLDPYEIGAERPFETVGRRTKWKALKTPFMRKLTSQKGAAIYDRNGDLYASS